MRHFLSRLRSYFIYDPLIWVYTIVLGILSLTASLFDRSGRIQHWFARTWSWLIMKSIFTPVTVEGLDRLDTTKTYVYASTHASSLDIPVLYAYLPFQFRILAKKELFRYPIFGWHLKRSGQISVDASSAFASMRSLNAAVTSLKAGMPVVVYPEGGRSPDGHIQPFQSGAFYMAIKAGVDIVPIAIIGVFEKLPLNTFHIKSGPVEMVIGEPIPVAGYTTRDMEKLSALVKEKIEEMYYSRASLQRPPATPAAAPEVLPQ